MRIERTNLTFYEFINYAVKTKNIISEIKWNLVSIFGKLVIDILFKTIKIEIKGFEKVKPLISSKKLY